MDVFALLHFAKIWGLHVREISVCEYKYIHEYPQKICGCEYGYGWKISYPRQACRSYNSVSTTVLHCVMLASPTPYATPR